MSDVEVTPIMLLLNETVGAYIERQNTSTTTQQPVCLYCPLNLCFFSFFFIPSGLNEYNGCYMWPNVATSHDLRRSRNAHFAFILNIYTPIFH